MALSQSGLGSLSAVTLATAVWEAVDTGAQQPHHKCLQNAHCTLGAATECVLTLCFADGEPEAQKDYIAFPGPSLC